MGSEAVNLPVGGPAADENHDSSAAKRDAEIAADIAELRSIVLAAARHFKVELPRDKIALPRPPRPSAQALSELARKLAEGYDEEAIVRHHVFLAPAESMLGPNQWESIFGLKSPAPRVTITPRSDGPLDTEGIHTLAEWQVSPLTAHHLYEYGYTADGRFYPLNVNRPADGSAYRVSISSKTSPPQPPWAGQRFGKEWFFLIHSKSDPLSLSIAVCQLLDRTFTPENAATRQMDVLLGAPSWLRAVNMFSKLFTGLWPTKGLGYNGRLLAACQYSHAEAPNCHIFQHHLRLLDASHSPSHSLPGLHREYGSIRSSKEGARLFVRERRISAAVRTTSSLDLPVFTMVVLMDFGTSVDASAFSSDYIERLDKLQRRAEMYKGPAFRSAGLVAFTLRLYRLLVVWAGEWHRTLGQFESELNIEVKDVLLRSKRRRIMYDDSDLAISELYFFISQLLRFSDIWIREGLDELSYLIRWIEATYFIRYPLDNLDGPFLSLSGDPEVLKESKEAFREALETLVCDQQTLGGPLLERINGLEKDVKRLREGLFTATAVSEATKSKQLNHYIIVFTVVTIFYLPLSFVASLYTLDVFDWDNPGQKTSFITTIILVALTTYAFSGYLVWFVGNPRRRKMVKKAKQTASVGKLFRRMRGAEKKRDNEEAASASETGSLGSDESEFELGRARGSSATESEGE